MIYYPEGMPDCSVARLFSSVSHFNSNEVSYHLLIHTSVSSLKSIFLKSPFKTAQTVIDSMLLFENCSQDESNARLTFCRRRIGNRLLWKK